MRVLNRGAPILGSQWERGICIEDAASKETMTTSRVIGHSLGLP